MTLNLTELRDEPLGKHPSHVALCSGVRCLLCDTRQDVVAAGYESISTFDVDGLSDEALDPRPAVNALCGLCISVLR